MQEKYVHIGIELPHSQPRFLYDYNYAYEDGRIVPREDDIQPDYHINDSALTSVFLLDGEEFVMQNNDILEFDKLFQTSQPVIRFKRAVDEYAIITIAYLDIDDI